jgi:hypothetical protein
MSPSARSAATTTSSTTATKSGLLRPPKPLPLHLKRTLMTLDNQMAHYRERAVAYQRAGRISEAVGQMHYLKLLGERRTAIIADFDSNTTS